MPFKRKQPKESSISESLQKVSEILAQENWRFFHQHQQTKQTKELRTSTNKDIYSTKECKYLIIQSFVCAGLIYVNDVLKLK